MTPEMHDRVMNRATRLWHEQGKPHGHYREFWEEARRELATEPALQQGSDELAAWAPARPLPRQEPSALRRIFQRPRRTLREVIQGP